MRKAGQHAIRSVCIFSPPQSIPTNLRRPVSQPGSRSSCRPCKCSAGYGYWICVYMSTFGPGFIYCMYVLNLKSMFNHLPLIFPAALHSTHPLGLTFLAPGCLICPVFVLPHTIGSGSAIVVMVNKTRQDSRDRLGGIAEG